MFGESRVQHYHEKQGRHWELDGNVVTELDKYKNLGVVKSYASSSRPDSSEVIEKNSKKGFQLAVLIAEKLTPLSILNCGAKSAFQPYYMVLCCGHLTLRFWAI